jgi:hypothetical protein
MRAFRWIRADPAKRQAAPPPTSGWQSKSCEGVALTASGSAWRRRPHFATERTVAFLPRHNIAVRFSHSMQSASGLDRRVKVAIVNELFYPVGVSVQYVRQVIAFFASW